LWFFFFSPRGLCWWGPFPFRPFIGVFFLPLVFPGSSFFLSVVCLIRSFAFLECPSLFQLCVSENRAFLGRFFTFCCCLKFFLIFSLWTTPGSLWSSISSSAVFRKWEGLSPPPKISLYSYPSLWFFLDFPFAARLSETGGLPPPPVAPIQNFCPDEYVVFFL